MCTCVGVIDDMCVFLCYLLIFLFFSFTVKREIELPRYLTFPRSEFFLLEP